MHTRDMKSPLGTCWTGVFIHIGLKRQKCFFFDVYLFANEAKLLSIAYPMET